MELTKKQALLDYLDWQLSDSSLYFDAEARLFKKECIELFEQNSALRRPSSIQIKNHSEKTLDALKKSSKLSSKSQVLSIKKEKKQIKQKLPIVSDCFNLVDLFSKISKQPLYLNKATLNYTEKKGSCVIVSLYTDGNDLKFPLEREKEILLSKMFNAIEKDINDFTIITLIKSPEIQFLSWKQLAFQLPFLLQEIKLLNFNKIIILGDYLAQLLLRTADDLPELRRKNLFLDNDKQVWVTDDLKNLIQNPKLKKEVWKDLQWIQAQL